MSPEKVFGRLKSTVFLSPGSSLFRITFRGCFRSKKLELWGGIFTSQNLEASNNFGLQRWLISGLLFTVVYFMATFLLSTIVNHDLWYFFQATTLNNSKFSKGEMCFFFPGAVSNLYQILRRHRKEHILTCRIPQKQNFPGQTWAPGSRYESSYV